MALSPRTVRISAALLISLGFIAAGYFFSTPFHTDIANADSNEAALKAYAVKDSDNDGLPDWQEALYGTDPNNAHSVSASMTDAEAVNAGTVEPKYAAATSSDAAPPGDSDFTVAAGAPGSVTDEFAKSFFQAVVESGGSAGGDTTALVQSLSADFSSRVAQKFVSPYAASSVQVSAGATPGSYAGAIEHAILGNQVPDAATDALPLISAAIEQNDAKAQANLLVLSKAYKAIATELAAAQVPPQFAATHLSLLNALTHLSQSTALIAGYGTDPLATLGALGMYQSASADLGAAFQAVVDAVTAGGAPAPGEPGALLLEIVRGSKTQ